MIAAKVFSGLCLLMCFTSCKKDASNAAGADQNPNQPSNFSLTVIKLDGKNSGSNYYTTATNPVIKISFSAPLNRTSVSSGIMLTNASDQAVACNTSFQNGDSTVVITPAQPLAYISRYSLSSNSVLKSAGNAVLATPVTARIITPVDNKDKFPIVSDDELLTLVQKQTFKYFWNFGHPVSGLARERNTSGDVVTTGGSGFGLMAMVTAVNRQFITREEGLARVQTIVSFLKNKAQTFHGAFPHWLNGTTGAVVPFSAQDNGADLVETSFLMEGLLVTRQYFKGSSAAEIALRNDINSLYQNVEWDWFRQGNQNTLYWHWSPNQGFAINMPITGWNEALVTYVLAASSTSHGIPKAMYDSGWAKKAAIKNGSSYYNVQLPLGPALGGPLFFEHYSFMGINPNGLTDTYADYQVQTRAHALINYNYCKANPKGNNGYSENCWGLTASDIPNGYTASSPSNDVGVIAPTAALASFPYTPMESMQALKFFYYKLGDKLWGEYGFYDAFSLNDAWFASSTLAIDQGPIIVMIENYRSSLIWNLFMSCPEVKTGMKNLGFKSANL
ncbi:Ig-like domain-containing protein [Mucilaginibacter sp. Bleaf8]|uniref:glucoamylase family protein n=1 Tax=Mucilaginibacter sp. Bleaf8 TaxID=2834430 RepID=UPI001BD1086C|nr:glucoamylase family protein [Mucilaginibacter sp. Bleaf8]MBS7565746.1 Ig-like domain-containing protein [Mucilaginibacter sp. Bleaf8]